MNVCKWCEVEPGACAYCSKKLTGRYHCVQPAHVATVLRGFHVCPECPSSVGKKPRRRRGRTAETQAKRPRLRANQNDFARYIPPDKKPTKRAATAASFREEGD